MDRIRIETPLWTLTAPPVPVITCALYRCDFGFEADAMRNGDLCGTELFRRPATSRRPERVADDWSTALLDKGFTLPSVP